MRNALGRLSLLATSSLLLACSTAAGEGDTGEAQGSIVSRESAGCALSREQILASASAARRTAIERGFTWLDDQVPYSQSAEHEGYRTDCSGFVSMCWELGTSETTATFIDGSGQDTLLGSYDDLLPADALVHRSGGSGHVVLFLGWNDDAHSGICVLEQANSASDMQFRVRTTDSLQGGGYEPIRASKLVDDTNQPANDPSLAASSPADDNGVGNAVDQDPAGGDTQPSATGLSGTGQIESCRASFYDEGQQTASGEPFNPDDLTAAHKTLPFNTMVRVTNTSNGQSVDVRINDRGPFVAGRCIDLSRAAFDAIASEGDGVASVTVEVLQ